MLDILAIKADVYQLERQGKRLPVYRYLREVWQKEPPSEGLTVLALQQMVDYVEYVDDLTVLGEPWEAENEYDLYQDFLLDVLMVVLGVLCGGRFGVCTIATIIIAGPIIQWTVQKF